MANEKELEQLTSLFRQLGADEPELWAKSQVEGGINQLHRYLFLRQAWRMIVPDDDQSWMDAYIAADSARPDEPFAGVGVALRELIDNGADRRLIGEVVRGMQAELLGSICYLLDDPSIEEPEAAHIGWRLVEADEDGDPTWTPIAGLHESVLETDPTGREMRTKGVSQ